MDASPIEQLLPPVVIISAGGLLMMAQFARFTAIVGRIRSLHQERLSCFERCGTADDAQRAALLDRTENLEHQAHRMLVLARMIRTALVLLVSAVICMLVSSLMIGVELVLPGVGSVAATVAFVAGIALMLAGMVAVMRELLHSLEIITDEHAHVEKLTWCDVCGVSTTDHERDHHHAPPAAATSA